MFTHILVPVDGSINSFAALDKAVALAGLTGAIVSILTVYRHHSLLEASLSMVRPENPRRFDDVMREQARGIAEKAKGHALAAGADEVHAYVRNGAIARGIVAFAKDRSVDLIVMGGRGVGSAENYMLGSISHKVTSLTQGPVMIV